MRSMRMQLCGRYEGATMPAEIVISEFRDEGLSRAREDGVRLRHTVVDDLGLPVAKDAYEDLLRP